MASINPAEVTASAPGMFEFGPAMGVLVPVTLGIVEAAKRIGMPAKFAPLVSVGVGIGLSALTAVTWQQCVVQGITVGLAASGLYSGAKKFNSG